jgi:hypothetical protein
MEEVAGLLRAGRFDIQKDAFVWLRSDGIASIESDIRKAQGELTEVTNEAQKLGVSLPPEEY